MVLVCAQYNEESEMTQIILGRAEYVHVIDNNTGVVRTVVGPCTYSFRAARR